MFLRDFSSEEKDDDEGKKQHETFKKKGKKLYLGNSIQSIIKT